MDSNARPIIHHFNLFLCAEKKFYHFLPPSSNRTRELCRFVNGKCKEHKKINSRAYHNIDSASVCTVANFPRTNVVAAALCRAAEFNSEGNEEFFRWFTVRACDMEMLNCFSYLLPSSFTSFRTRCTFSPWPIQATNCRGCAHDIYIDILNRARKFERTIKHRVQAV